MSKGPKGKYLDKTVEYQWEKKGERSVDEGFGWLGIKRRQVRLERWRTYTTYRYYYDPKTKQYLEPQEVESHSKMDNADPWMDTGVFDIFWGGGSFDTGGTKVSIGVHVGPGAGIAPEISISNPTGQITVQPRDIYTPPQATDFSQVQIRSDGTLFIGAPAGEYLQPQRDTLVSRMKKLIDNFNILKQTLKDKANEAYDERMKRALTNPLIVLDGLDTNGQPRVVKEEDGILRFIKNGSEADYVVVSASGFVRDGKIIGTRGYKANITEMSRPILIAIGSTWTYSDLYKVANLNATQLQRFKLHDAEAVNWEYTIEALEIVKSPAESHYLYNERRTQARLEELEGSFSIPLQRIEMLLRVDRTPKEEK